MAKDLFNKYIWLVDTIYRNKKLTLEEINNKWERSDISNGRALARRTFHYHRDTIESLFNINIECDKKNGYCYYIENTEEIENKGVRSWLLSTFSINNLVNESVKLKDRILFENIPSGQQFLSTIINAMKDNLVIELTYKSFWKNEESTFQVRPYFVKVFKQRWYFIGKSIGYDSLRTYSLDRIVNIETTKNKFSMPKEFDCEDFLKNSFGIITDDSCKPEEVLVKVFGNQVNYFRSLPLHHSQEEIEKTSDYSIFKYKISTTFDLKKELLSQGANIEVLKPLHLREEMRDIAKQMLALLS